MRITAREMATLIGAIDVTRRSVEAVPYARAVTELKSYCKVIASVSRIDEPTGVLKLAIERTASALGVGDTSWKLAALAAIRGDQVDAVPRISDRIVPDMDILDRYPVEYPCDVQPPE